MVARFLKSAKNALLVDKEDRVPIASLALKTMCTFTQPAATIAVAEAVAADAIALRAAKQCTIGASSAFRAIALPAQRADAKPRARWITRATVRFTSLSYKTAGG